MNDLSPLYGKIYSTLVKSILFSLSNSVLFQSFTNNKICNQCLDMIILIRGSLCNVMYRYKKNRNENLSYTREKYSFSFRLNYGNEYISCICECYFSPFLRNKEKDVITNYIIFDVSFFIFNIIQQRSNE